MMDRKKGKMLVIKPIVAHFFHEETIPDVRNIFDGLSPRAPIEPHMTQTRNILWREVNIHGSASMQTPMWSHLARGIT